MSTGPSQNDEFLTRYGIITVTAGELTREITIIQSGSDYTRKNVSVGLYYHQSYKDEFQYLYAANARSALSDAEMAFANRWNIHFEGQERNISTNLPMDECNVNYKVPCPHGIIHKDCGANLDYFRDYIFNKSGSKTDLGVLIYSDELGTLGLSDSNKVCIVDYRAIVPSDYINAETYRCRLLQHEMSHCYGAPDGYPPNTTCNPTQDCIMRRGFDKNIDFNNDTIWCSNCEARFNRNKH